MGISSRKNKTDFVSDDPKVAHAIEEIQRIMREGRAKEAVKEPYPSLYDPDAAERCAALEAEEKNRSPLMLERQAQPEGNQESKWDKDKKRFVVLLLAAGWIMIAGFVSYSDFVPYEEHATGHTVFQFFVYSLPAILFGGVLFWWFGKEAK